MADVTGRSRRQGPLITLLIADGVSLTGTAVSLVAVPWYVLATTNSPTATGIVSTASIFAMVAAGVMGGPVVDRLGYRRASIVADLFSAAATAAIPAIHAEIGLTLWQLVLLAAVRSLFDSLGTTARMSLLPELSQTASMRLERTNSVRLVVARASSVVGAPLGGLMIALVGPANALWADASSFFLSSLIVAAAVPRRVRQASLISTRTYLGDLLQGLTPLLRNPLLVSITSILAVVNLLESPLFGVVLPVHAHREYGSSVALGILFGSNAAGGIAGAVLFALLAPRLPRRSTFVLAFMLVATGMWGLALAPGYVVASAAFCLTGIASGPINPLVLTVVQERVPETKRATVIGASRSIAFSTGPLGVFVAGVALQSVSTTIMLFVLAVVYLATTIAVSLNPVFKQMNPVSST